MPKAGAKKNIIVPFAKASPRVLRLRNIVRNTNGFVIGMMGRFSYLEYLQLTKDNILCYFLCT